MICISPRLSGSVEDAKTAAEVERVTAEAKKWFEAVEESDKAIKYDKGDEEVDKLAEAVKGGLQICTELLREEDPGRSEEWTRCKQVFISFVAHAVWFIWDRLKQNCLNLPKRLSEPAAHFLAQPRRISLCQQAVCVKSGVISKFQRCLI